MTAMLFALATLRKRGARTSQHAAQHTRGSLKPRPPIGLARLHRTVCIRLQIPLPLCAARQRARALNARPGVPPAARSTGMDIDLLQHVFHASDKNGDGGLDEVRQAAPALGLGEALAALCALVTLTCLCI